MLILAVGGCGFGAKRSGKSYVINGKRYHILASADGYREKGQASWYGEPFHGRQTASGEVYDMNQISAAHKTLPLHTWVEVKNLDNNKSLVLRINDRGPFVRGRIIDLSKAAALEMGMLGNGLAKVTVTAISADKASRLSGAKPNNPNKAVATVAPGGPLITQEPAVSAGTKPGFGVRVISTGDRGYAENVAGALKKNYPNVSLNSYDHNGQVAYIVTVDGLSSQKEADKTRSRLAFRGYEEAKVVAR